MNGTDPERGSGSETNVRVSHVNPMQAHNHSHIKEDNVTRNVTIDPDYVRPSLHELATREFYQQEGWFEQLCEALFKIKYRGTTIKAEAYHGIIHFISCLYCLAVVPQQMSSAGYDSNNVVVAVALLCGVGSISCGLFANLPFVLAPPTVVTIFLSVYLQQHAVGPRVGNYGVILSGFLMMFFFWRPLGDLMKHIIPAPIQVGTVVGIGLMTTLAGSTEVEFVIAGHYKILRMGHITPEIVIVFAGVIIICVAMQYHIKGSFCLAVLFCSVTYWSYDRSFPDQIFAVPTLTTAYFAPSDQTDLPLLTVDLLFLYILYLNGLLTSLSNLAVLTRNDDTIPRGRWIFILSGFFTICGGLLTTAPILVSPESAAAIKEGAKTGLSTVVCGILFIFASFFSPLFRHIPAAGTSPVLIMIGVILFQNVNRVDWRNVADAAPAFVVLFYIPFTYSIIQGVILGYIMYLSITLCTGELLENTLAMLLHYFPDLEERLLQYPMLVPYLPHHCDDDDDHDSHRKSEDSHEESDSGATRFAGARTESTASRAKGSRQNSSSVLEAFIDMNPGMSFSDPADRPARKHKKKKKHHKHGAADGQHMDVRTPSRSSSDYPSSVEGSLQSGKALDLAVQPQV